MDILLIVLCRLLAVSSVPLCDPLGDIAPNFRPIPPVTSPPHGDCHENRRHAGTEENRTEDTHGV